MCKKWARLPRNVTLDDVNAKMRERRDRQEFLDELKEPKQKYMEITHDGTDTTVGFQGTQTTDGAVINCPYVPRGSYREFQTNERSISDTEATETTKETRVSQKVKTW